MCHARGTNLGRQSPFTALPATPKGPRKSSGISWIPRRIVGGNEIETARDNYLRCLAT
jgi:hypothetical protein